MKKYVYFSLVIILISADIIFAQCPNIHELLDNGYHFTADSVTPVRGPNQDEVAFYNSTEPFLLKIDNYPPMRSWLIPICGGINYLSFDTESDPFKANGPVPYIVSNSGWHNVTTYYASDSAHSFQVRPPSDIRVGPPPDFILTSEGRVHLIAWDSVLKDYPTDSLIRQNTIVSYPVLGVQLSGPSNMEYGNIATVTANVTGGEGGYRFLWQWRKLPNGNWNNITKVPDYQWIITNVYCYFYKGCFKLDIPMPEDSIEVKVTIQSYSTPKSIEGEPDEVITSNTLTIKSLPTKYKIANEIYGDKTKGFLVLDNITSRLLPSDTSVTLAPLSSHALRTNELPFFYNWNGYGGHVKQIYWNGLNNPNSLAHTFIVDYDTPKEFIAHFEETKPVTVWNNFDGYDIAADSIKLRDPWYYYQKNGNWLKSEDWQACRPSPMALDNSTAQSYGGVFLNTTTAPSWEPPYYSLANRQNDTAVINRGNYSTKHRLYFLGWAAAAEDAEIRYPS
ncbi:MAG: hypothetical protein HYV28_07865 [Ignavibacteriales bacterium]|nr:hypothetical protein [Ignavibacteriales bacterium]